MPSQDVPKQAPEPDSYITPLLSQQSLHRQDCSNSSAKHHDASVGQITKVVGRNWRSEEGPNVQDASRSQRGKNSVDFGRVHANPFGRDNVAQKGDGLNVEFTFCGFEIETCCLEAFED